MFAAAVEKAKKLLEAQAEDADKEMGEKSPTEHEEEGK
jgi:hypothetical protein